MKAPVLDPSWAPDVQALYRHDMREIWDPAIARQIWNQYHNQLDIYCALAQGCGSLDILDVGCAQATLALILAERGHHVCAMDIRQPFLDYAASRHEHGDIRFVCGNVMEDSPGGRYDLIYANQIIEHLVYPVELISRLSGWLKPGGRLVVTTPNGSYVRNSLPAFSELGDPAKHADRQFTADGDGHFFAYRPHELVDVMKASGLRDVELRYFESPWISGHMKIRYLHDWLPAPPLRTLDRITLRIPGLGGRMAHQLLATGRSLPPEEPT